jgi:hypothetical protein
MMLFSLWSHHPVRMRERDRLTAAGYRWQPFRLVEYAGLSLFGLFCTASAIWFYAIGAPLVALALFVGGTALIAFLAVRAKCPHLILFTADGRVRSPHGIAQRVWWRDLGPVLQVASIELTNACRDFGVVLLTTEGHTYLIAERMRRLDARLVAVQLTKALHEMRTGMASVGAHSARPAPIGSEVWVH